MDGDMLSPDVPDKAPPERRRVLEHDAADLSAAERAALLERIDAEIADIDGRDDGNKKAPEQQTTDR